MCGAQNATGTQRTFRHSQDAFRTKAAKFRGSVKYSLRHFVMKMVLQEVSQQKFKVKLILFRFIRVIIEQKNRVKN